MSTACLVVVTSISGFGVIMNTVLLVFLFIEKNHIALKTILISLSCSDIALSFVLISRTVIPVYLKDNASTSFAALMFGIYCNMINIILMTTERMIATFSSNKKDFCMRRSFLLISIALIWIACIPMAVSMGFIDLHNDIANYVEAKIVPFSFAATSFISILLHLIMCCRMQFELKREISSRGMRSLGKGLVITSRKGLALRQAYRHVGLSFGLVVCYAVLNYPFMLYSFLTSENPTYCQGPGMGLYNLLVAILAFKTVADPLICILITVCIPKYWKQLQQQENESST